MTITLFRAADRETVVSGTCLAADRDSAAEYLDNPGYGGSTLYSLTVDIHTDAVLSLVDGRRNGVPHGRMARDAWHRLADALSVDVTDLRDGAESIEREIDSPKRRAALAKAGYLWVVYEDTYPSQCVTWVYLGAETLVLEEVE